MTREGKHMIEDWDVYYRETPMEELPWYAEGVDPEVMAAISRFCPSGGRALDLGTGPGTMAIELAKLGYEVTATDISVAALESASKRVPEGYYIEFIVDDIRETELTGPFEIINDRGCFHVLEGSEERRAYVKNVSKILGVGGVLLLKTFSTKEEGSDGPSRFDPPSILSIFDDSFEVLHSEESVFVSTLPEDPRALLSVLKKKV